MFVCSLTPPFPGPQVTPHHRVAVNRTATHQKSFPYHGPPQQHPHYASAARAVPVATVVSRTHYEPVTTLELAPGYRRMAW